MNKLLDEYGYVKDADLAKKLISQFLYRICPITAWKEQEILKECEVYYNDSCGGWCINDKEGEDYTFGYNGIVIMTLDRYLKDIVNGEALTEDDADYLNNDSMAIWPWDNEKGYEIFCFHEGD